MRLPWRLGLALLLALTSGATDLDIPLEVEQLPTITLQTTGPVIALPMENSLTLRCEAKGTPPPDYRWTKDGEEFEPFQDLRIRTAENNGSFTLQHRNLVQSQGRYRCYASNKMGTAISEEIQIIVPGVPKFPKETFEPRVVEEGQAVVLPCNPPEGSPPRQIYWMSIGLQHIEQDERVSMGNDANLYFSNVLEKDSRRDYCCFAAFPAMGTIVQKTAMSLVVKRSEAMSERKPQFLTPPGVQSEVHLVKGKELELECISEGFPTPEVEWMKLGEKLPKRTNIKNYGKLLTISNAGEEDSGMYSCEARNTVGKVVHYFTVIVEEPPKWLSEPPRSQLVLIGADVHMRCSVSGKPKPTTVWMRNGQPLDDAFKARSEVSEDRIVITNARPEDSAVYQCEASNTHGTILANANIMVMNMAPLILTKGYLEYSVVQGGDTVMACRVFGSPTPSVTWNRLDIGAAVAEGDGFSFSKNGSLEISRAKRNDSGEYACLAFNSEGKSLITALLHVKEPTRIVEEPLDLQVLTGATAQLACKAHYDITLGGDYQLLWRKDWEEIPLAFNKHSRYFVDDGTLHILNVSQSDEGRYTCIARTSLDQDTASADVTVLDVPDAPENLNLSEHKTRSVLLSWVPGHEHNSSVLEFIVEFEEDQWEPGKWRTLQSVPGNQATAVLELQGHINYQFRVYAVNAIGHGPPSAPTERFKTFPAAPDKNPENIRIQGHLPQQMDISWEPLLPLEHNGPGLEYKVSYRRLGVEDQWKELLVKRHSFVVKNTPTFVPYEIKIQSRNSHGWGPEPKVVTGYSGEDAPTAAPRDVAVELMNTTLLRVSWSTVPQATVRGHLGGYNVHWQRRKSLLHSNRVPEDKDSMSFPGNRSHAMVPGLKPYSEYRLTVNVFNKKGNGPSSDPVTFQTPEGVPEQVPILTASNGQSDSITLVWGPPFEANGVLTGYLLQYQLMNETLDVGELLEVNVSGSDSTQWVLEGLTEASVYRVHLRACTRAGCGAPLTQEASTLAVARSAGLQGSISTQGWFIGLMCAVAILTLVVLITCFVHRNKGGKYAVKEKEDLQADDESQGMNDDTFCEYSDSDEKPLKGSLRPPDEGGEGGDSLSGDSLVEYADGEGLFDEDGSFIGEYSGRRRRGSVDEPNGPTLVSA